MLIVASAVRARPAAPRIDGVLDETAWGAAPVFSDFLQQDPDEGEPATEPTEFRVLYTNDALFVAVRAYDSVADEIAAILARRDQRSPSDEVTINIDSYHDRQCWTSVSRFTRRVTLKPNVLLSDGENRNWLNGILNSAVHPSASTVVFTSQTASQRSSCSLSLNR